MNRSSHHHRHLQLQQQQLMADNDAAALAAELFDHFCVATTMRQVLGLYRNMSDTLGLRPAPMNDFYPKLKAKIRNWKAQALWKKFDARASHRVYNKGNACTGSRVLVIGAGPCGLRTAIEAQLLGAKVVVVEKRDRISRNNVLHLWPFVITDLRNLGAKKFYGKFCAGSIDHISIRQLQCILLKVALLLGVEVHEGVSFLNTLEPSDGCGWRAQITPEDHAVSHYEFDVLIGADGKRNTLEGFKRKEFRGKLAIAITANFINKKTEAEAKAEEISGVAFIFNQTFFKELYQKTGIDLENIVYYKDETHYFVMTAKKHSLIDKGVIMQDFADPAELLAPANVNTEKLLDYAREAAEFSTKYQMPNLEFAVNHYGKPDVAMFDFTSMFAAESSCRVIVRKNYRLLQCLVGDSLLEPFWPTGSGCARGFLSSMDSAYIIKLWANSRNSILAVLAQRESIYRLLAQTTPENLQRDIGAYTVDPATRYPNLNKTTVNVWQVKHLLDTDDVLLLEQTFIDTNAIQAAPTPETPIRRKRRTGDILPLSAVLLRWIKAQLNAHEFTQNLGEVSDCFTNGKVLCALINRYRPDLVDLNTLKDYSAVEGNELAFKIMETELGVPRVMSAKDSVSLEGIDSKIWLNYLEQICEVFRGEVPHVKHPKLDVAEFRDKTAGPKVPDFSKLLKITSSRKSKSPMQDVDMANVVHRRSVLDEEKVRRQRKYGPDFHPAVQVETTSRRAKKRRSHEKSGNIEERQQRLKEIEANRLDRQSKRRLQRFQQTQNFYKSLQMLQANTILRESDENSSAFEDYSLYMYRQQAPEFNDRVKELERKLLYPDRERGIPSSLPKGSNDGHFNDRIRSMEQQITRNAAGFDKKPKDLLRAIGKIESSDWNIKQIEKKIEQSKKTEIGKSKEKVPKWSKEQFLARQTKMSKPTRQESEDEKFKEIDQTLKNLDKQLKGGALLEVGERGKNKVASIAGQFGKKDDTSEEKNVVQKSNSKVNLLFKKQGASEKCHFCKQTVYLMEKISTEGLILHRSCLKCHHCHTNLRLGGYAFDRDDPVGRFYCTQHFRLPAKPTRPAARKSNRHRKPTEENNPAAAEDAKTPERNRGRVENVAQFDLLDRGQTPERIEFENTDAMSDGEPSLENIIDENEWTDRNFITGSEDSESDISSSESSDDDTDSDMFEEANGSPIGAQTLQLATDWIGKQRYSNMDDSDDEDFYDSSDGMLDDDADSQTEGEEFKKAREMRRQEVKVMPPPAYLPTDTETEVVSKDVTQQINTNNNINDNEFNCNKTDKNDNNIINKDNNKSASAKNLHELVDSEAQLNVNVISPTKTDIKIIETQTGRRVSLDIDALSENLYNLNNLIKLNKDVVILEKQNMLKNDMMKKLSLKEKWLNENSTTYLPNDGKTSVAFPGNKGESNEDLGKVIRQEKTESNEGVKENLEEKKSEENLKQMEEEKKDLEKNRMEEIKAEDQKLDEKEDEDVKMADIKLDDIKLETDKIDQGKPEGDKFVEEKVDDIKMEVETPQNVEMQVVNTEDDKKEDVPMEIDAIQDTTQAEIKPEESKNEDPKPIERKKIKKDRKLKKQKTEIDSEELEIEKLVNDSLTEKDLGKFLYDVESKFSPKVKRKVNESLKKIDVQNFSDTMDSIKSRITGPKISKQASLDISKYFPNQKSGKAAAAPTNKNQKTLKDVDLTKYFGSPVLTRKGSVAQPTSPQPSPAMRRRSESQQGGKGTEKLIPKSKDEAILLIRQKMGVPQENKPQHKNLTVVKPNALSRPLAKRNSLAAKGKTQDVIEEDEDSSIFNQLLDGAVDIKPTTKKVVIKKVPKKAPRKSIAPKSPKANTKSSPMQAKQTLEVVDVFDVDEEMFEDLLQSAQEMRSPSKEYQNLFHDEKSPSEDISDKIQQILKGEAVPVVSPRKKKLQKTKSLGDDEKCEDTKIKKKTLSGPDLRKPDENLENLTEKETLVKSENGSAEKIEESTGKQTPLEKMTDLEKTMEYLREEWRTEATNFLQRKRDSFNAKRQKNSVKKPFWEKKQKEEQQVQSDSESSSPGEVEQNSATEISTDSEFDHDPIIREAPRIFIDDTHLKKPTRVQIKQGMITSNPYAKTTSSAANNQNQTAMKPEIEFKPLVQVDPSLLPSNRMPLKNPRPGDYLLNKTPSTEGIASKKSLELKKRYLLGEQGMGIGIMKSGSTSILDSKFKNFHSNISECQKLLNPGSDISPSMKKFLDRTKVGEVTPKKNTEVESKDSDEKENVFVNGQNELNKEMEFSETINTALVESKSKELAQKQKQLPSPIIETIDLISPEKAVPIIIDIAQIEIPSTMVKTNQEFISNLKIDDKLEDTIIDLTVDTPVKEVKNLSDDSNVSSVRIEKPDVSKDVKEVIPDIITEAAEVKVEKKSLETNGENGGEAEDEEALLKENDIQDTCIKVPNIPWNNTRSKSDVESDSLSSSSSSSLEDIPHYILDSTTSPDTQNGMEPIVPRLEIHDTSGTLMQIDSLMIIDGKYVGDPEDLKHMEIPKGTKVDLASAARNESTPFPKSKAEPKADEEPTTKEDLMSNSSKPDLKFDTKNENKIETLKNLPLILDKDAKSKSLKPKKLELDLGKKDVGSSSDKDKTPTADHGVSDSETEVTGQVLTETELSDWTADDAVSENFVDIEFALNSNKGTIKRNKKAKRKVASPKVAKPVVVAPVEKPKECGILKNLDIEEIEFMDTGSEGSCAEAYSATNKAMLQNRGYIEFIEHTHSPVMQPSGYAKYEPPEPLRATYSSQLEQLAEAMNKEILGVDYIEQGACILNNDIDLKTPVNEIPPFFATKSNANQNPGLFPVQMDSLNDIDDDSLLMISSQGTGTTTTTTTTTEESEALTVVTSPQEAAAMHRNKEASATTPSSSDKNEKTISDSFASKIPVRKSSTEESRKRLSQEDILKRKDSDEMSYEEYVRKLQMKITQISNARDSIDVRKHKRKSSKGDLSETTAQQNTNSVIENKSLSIFEPPSKAAAIAVVATATGADEQQQLEAQESVEAEENTSEVPAVSKKLQEITKERTKQKDLIHDLVMDKLQSKKQLNAEKRLNRSRNRSLFSPGSNFVSTPKVVAATNNCSNSPHYHVSERRNSKSGQVVGDELDVGKKSSSGIKAKSPKDSKDVVQMFTAPLANRSKDRPLSDNLESVTFEHTPKITKTQSFCVYTTKDLYRRENSLECKKSPLESTNSFSTPIPPPRSGKKSEELLTSNTDKLRAEARARARLKSNQDLGLSPEEKLQVLRKRYHLDMNEAIATSSASTSHNKNQSDDMKVRERKMMTSKSVNDITAVQNLLNSDENFNTKSSKVSDFISDPNLTESQDHQQDLQHHQQSAQKTRRRKDPERRKSLIQTVSNFFHKKKNEKDSPSPTKEKSATDGVFSRFRISPKTKEKSKEKEDMVTSYERSKSQDCLKYETSSHSSSPQLFKETTDEVSPPPIPPLPLNYQRSDDESYTNETREQKKQRALSKASRQAELKRLRIAQEIQREQEEIEVKLKELEARGVLIEKALRGEGQNMETLETSSMGASDEKLLKELLEIWRSITQLKKRDEELGIRQQELQLEHRHAQLKEELNTRLSCSKLDKSSADVAAEGAILNEMLEIVAKRAALRPNETSSVARLSNENDSDM